MSLLSSILEAGVNAFVPGSGSIVGGLVDGLDSSSSNTPSYSQYPPMEASLRWALDNSNTQNAKTFFERAKIHLITYPNDANSQMYRRVVKEYGTDPLAQISGSNVGPTPTVKNPPINNDNVEIDFPSFDEVIQIGNNPKPDNSPKQTIMGFSITTLTIIGVAVYFITKKK